MADWDGSNPVRIADGRPPERCGAPGENSSGEYSGAGPIWSPDGRYLAFRRTNCEGPGGARPHVVISDREGNVLAELPGEGWEISWSPDSTRVAVWVTVFETIGVFGLDGGRRALLTMPRGGRPSGDHDPMWSPDGKSLLLQDVVIPIDGSTPYHLQLADRGPAGGTYAPDGSRVAYVARRALVVADADGSSPRVVFDDRVFNPVWSPTDDRIAFTTQRVGGRGLPNQLRVVDLATGTVTLLAEAGGSDALEAIDFSPDGDQIFFSRSGVKNVGSLWSVDSGGSDLRRLVTGTAWGDWLSPGLTP